jgi:hypothetical protein
MIRGLGGLEGRRSWNAAPSEKGGGGMLVGRSGREGLGWGAWRARMESYGILCYAGDEMPRKLGRGDWGEEAYRSEMNILISPPPSSGCSS